MADSTLEELTEIDRLDLVARAEASKVALARFAIPLTFVTLFGIALAVFAGASAYEMAAVRVVAILSVVTTVMLWQSSRYAGYALAILLLLFLIGGWRFADPDDHTVIGSMANLAGSAILLAAVYRCWTNAAPLVAAQSKKLAGERSQVGEWIGSLKSSTQTDHVIEFSSRSFVRGYWTYRLLNTGFCWVTAKFKTGHLNRLLSCRVLGLEAVNVTDQPGGKLCVRMGNVTIQQAEMTADMRGRLLGSLTKRNGPESDPLLPGSLR